MYTNRNHQASVFCWIQYAIPSQPANQPASQPAKQPGSVSYHAKVWDYRIPLLELLVLSLSSGVARTHTNAYSNGIWKINFALCRLVVTMSLLIVEDCTMSHELTPHTHTTLPFHAQPIHLFCFSSLRQSSFALPLSCCLKTIVEQLGQGAVNGPRLNLRIHDVRWMASLRVFLIVYANGAVFCGLRAAWCTLHHPSQPTLISPHFCFVFTCFALEHPPWYTHHINLYWSSSPNTFRSSSTLSLLSYTVVHTSCTCSWNILAHTWQNGLCTQRGIASWGRYDDSWASFRNSMASMTHPFKRNVLRDLVVYDSCICYRNILARTLQNGLWTQRRPASLGPLW